MTQQWMLIMLFILQLKSPGRSEILQVKYQESFPLTPTPPLCPPGQFLHGSLMDLNYITALEGRKVLTQARTMETHDRISDLYKVMQET